uniref:CCT domain-containing protein n=1 Tax=Leersia perrieri TaxID=77586 RepID=A0A0D9WTR0_9ORYZ
MASSCIPTGLRLDMAAAAAAAAHSSASSTLSEASNSSSSVASLSLKRARTPRKRPNQTYNEAAALLASMYPTVFPVAGKTAPPRLLGLASALADDPSSSDLLPPFPVPVLIPGGGAGAYLLRDTPPPATPRCAAVAHVKGCSSPAPVSSVFREFRDAAPSPGTPDADAGDDLGELDFEDEDGFDADSFLAVDDGAAEGIDSIMGKLTMEKNSATASRNDAVLSSAAVHPYLRSLMVLGLGFRQRRASTDQALKRHDDRSDWWMCPAIPVKDIAPPPATSVAVMPPLPVSDKKKKSKKKSLKEMERENSIAVVGQCKFGDEGALGFDHGDAGISALKDPKIGLGLNLNTEEVLKAWCDRGSVFAGSDALESPRSSADFHAKLADIDLFLDNSTSGVIREGSVLKMRHKQKQCTPLLSNKTRYQSRKGKYVSQASLLQQLSEKES